MERAVRGQRGLRVVMDGFQCCVEWNVDGCGVVASTNLRWLGMRERIARTWKTLLGEGVSFD
jgi:hypothetical protein